MIIPVVITVYAGQVLHLYYQDAACGCFDYEGPPRSKRLGEPNRNKVGSLPSRMPRWKEIAKLKLL